jgi:hypothetical protein
MGLRGSLDGCGEVKLLLSLLGFEARIVHLVARLCTFYAIKAAFAVNKNERSSKNLR